MTEESPLVKGYAFEARVVKFIDGSNHPHPVSMERVALPVDDFIGKSFLSQSLATNAVLQLLKQAAQSETGHGLSNGFEQPIEVENFIVLLEELILKLRREPPAGIKLLTSTIGTEVKHSIIINKK